MLQVTKSDQCLMVGVILDAGVRFILTSHIQRNVALRRSSCVDRHTCVISCMLVLSLLNPQSAILRVHAQNRRWPQLHVIWRSNKHKVSIQLKSVSTAFFGKEVCWPLYHMTSGCGTPVTLHSKTTVCPRPISISAWGTVTCGDSTKGWRSQRV